MILVNYRITSEYGTRLEHDVYDGSIDDWLVYNLKDPNIRYVSHINIEKSTYDILCDQLWYR